MYFCCIGVLLRRNAQNNYTLTVYLSLGSSYTKNELGGLNVITNLKLLALLFLAVKLFISIQFLINSTVSVHFSGL